VDTDKITLTFEKKIWRRNEEKAKEIAAKLHPIINKDDAAVILSTNRDEFKHRNFETYFRLSVPKNIKIDVTNSYGLVKVFQVGAATIDNRHGEVAAANVQGELDIENSYENVTLEDIQSRCQVKSRSSDISAKRVSGEMQIEQAYGLVKLQDVGQKIVIDGPHSEIDGEDLAGPLEIRNSYEKVALRRVGPTKIEGHHSAVEANDVNGNLEISDSYETVNLGNINGNLLFTGKSAGVAGTQIVGEEIYISSSYESISLSDFAGKTTILNSHGDVNLTPRPLTGPIEVRCDYTPIIFYWPGEDSYPLEAQTKSSDIYWRLAGSPAIEEKDGLTTARAFSDVVGKPRILLVTSYDEIRIEKGPAR
jgi:hypothetical protein